MFINEIRNQLVESIQTITHGIGEILPNIIGAFVLIVLGAVFGGAVGRVVEQGARAAKLDTLLEKAGVSRVIAKAGYHLNSALVLGWLAKMFFVVIFLVAAFDVLGLAQVNEFLKQVLYYIPNVFVAALILFCGIACK